MAYLNASGQLDNGLGLISRLQVATVTVTAAQLNSMFTTPVQILPSPGVNQAYIVGGVTMQTKPTTTAFAAGGAINLVYHGGAVVPHASSVPAATLISGTGTVNQLPGIAAVIQIPSNAGIDITCATANFTTGTGVLVVKIRFNVISTS